MDLLNFDSLATSMIIFISFLFIGVGGFASKYLKGDILYRTFFFRLALLFISLVLMVSSNNLMLLLLSLFTSNIIFTLMMIHKPSWKAAKASGLLAAKNFILGFLFLSLAFLLIYIETKELNIQTILSLTLESKTVMVALVFIIIAAMTQSGIWPFHLWLTSSLNSPTPVSALMHAGLVNGGGFLLLRFSNLYLNYPGLLNTIFIIGMFSAIVGTLWKLIQNDIKRMLAFSTLGQMGFMLVQFGLGLFSTAFAHIILHGMFKSYLFLNSGSAAKEKKVLLTFSPTLTNLMLGLVFGVFGAITYNLITHKQEPLINSSFLITAIVYLFTAQLAIIILQKINLKNIIVAFGVCLTSACCYGFSHKIITMSFTSDRIISQPLNFLHIWAIAFLIIGWLFVLYFTPKNQYGTNAPNWFKQFYVKALNSSQPHPTTITTHHNDYKYV